MAEQQGEDRVAVKFESYGDQEYRAPG